MLKLSTLAVASIYMSFIKAMPLRPLFFLVSLLQLSYPIKSVAMLTRQGIWAAAVSPAAHSNVLAFEALLCCELCLPFLL